VTGVVFAVGAAILAAVASGAPGFGSDTLLSDGSVTATVSPDPPLLIPGAFLVVTLGGLLGRAAVAGPAQGARNGRAWLGQQLGVWRTDVRHALALVSAVVVVTLLAALSYGGYQLLHTALTSGASGSTGIPGSSDSSTDGHAIAGGIVALVLSLPNLLLTAAGGAMGATGGVGGSEARTILSSGRTGGGLLTGGVPLGLYLLIIPMLLAALIVGARLLYARDTDQDRAGHTWRTVTVFGALWLLLGVALQLSVSEHGSAQVLSQFSGDTAGNATVGLGLPSLVAVALFWGVVSAAGGPLVGRFLAAATPRFATRLAGRHVSAEWRLLLADSVLTHGSKMPQSLTGAELALRQGQRPHSQPLVIRPARDRTILAGFLAVVMLAVGGGVGYVVLSDTVYSPDSVVRSYIADLHTGDVRGALALVSKSSLRGLDRTLLTKDVLAHADVPSVEIVNTDQSGDSATVTVTVNGESASLDLVREGRVYGVLPTWRLEQPFTMLQIPSAAAAAGVSVNGVGTYATSLPVFPGTYTLATVPSGIYASASSTVTADGTGSQDVALNPSLNADASTAATDAVKAFLDSCALSTELIPADCPFSYSDDYNTVSSATWSIANYPEVTVTDNSGTLEVTDVRSDGMAHLEAVTINYDGSSSPLSQDVPFAISGTMDWAGGDPTSATFTTS
jgi:hypothetical protein